MDVYASEKDQVEFLKELWNKYGKGLILGVVLALIGSFSWRAWQHYRDLQSEKASELYEQVLVRSEEHDEEAVVNLTNQLKKEYARTPYPAIAALALAKYEVEQKNYEKAKLELEWVMNKGSEKSIQEIARLRLARLLLAENKAQDALNLLNKAKGSAFISLQNETKGDIYVGLGDFQHAEESYQAAVNSWPNAEETRPLLMMKLNSSHLKFETCCTSSHANEKSGAADLKIPEQNK